MARITPNNERHQTTFSKSLSTSSKNKGYCRKEIMKADRVKMTEHIKKGLYYILGFLSENESRKNSRVTFFFKC